MTTTDDIFALEVRRWAAQIGKDESELATLLSDELRYTHSNGSIDTKASYMASILNDVVDYQSVDHVKIEAQVVGTAAIINGRAIVAAAVGGRQLELNVAYTVVWVERDGVWQLLTWQSTPLGG